MQLNSGKRLALLTAQATRTLNDLKELNSLKGSWMK
jgi:hypothetical protein